MAIILLAIAYQNKKLLQIYYLKKIYDLFLYLKKNILTIYKELNVINYTNQEAKVYL